MTSALEPNPGDRPSRLMLARYATGELDGEQRAAIETWLANHPEGQDYLDRLEASRARVALLDPEALRKRAEQVLDAAPAIPEPANRPAVGWRWAVPLVLAALAVLFLLVGGPQDDPYDPIRVKGESSLLVHQLGEDALLHPYDGTAKGEGDALGFRVRTAGHDRVVVLSVDGTGNVSVFYPESGSGFEPLAGGAGEISLPGTIRLDGAPGPEIFVAVFGETAEQARRDLESTYQSGGHEAVLDWAAHDADVDAVSVERQ